MDEVAIYSRVLPAARVVAHALAGKLDVPPLAASAKAIGKPRQSLLLDAGTKFNWELWQGDQGWALGAMSFNGQPVELPATAGALGLRKKSTDEIRWFFAETAERIGPAAARLSGMSKVDASVFRFTVDIALVNSMPAARWTAAWSVDKDLAGWEVCMAPWESFSHRWRCWLYPFAGNNAQVGITPLRYSRAPVT